MALFVAWISGIAALFLYAYFPVTAALSCGTALCVLLSKKKFSWVLVFMLAAGYAAVRGNADEPHQSRPHGEVRATGWFLPGEAERGYAVFEIDEAVENDTGSEADDLEGERIVLPAGEDGEHEEKQSVLLQLHRDRTRLNPGSAPGRRYSWKLLSLEKADAAPADFFRSSRDALNRFTAARFEPEVAALIVALTTGETGLIDIRVREAFNVTGLAHILSISGTHFGLFSVMVFGCLVFLVNRLPERALLRLTVILTPKQAAALLTFPVILLYLGLSGGSIPAIRSFIMVALFLASLLIERRHAGLRALAFAAFLLCLWDPLVLFDLSFQLSFLAVAGIGFVAGRDDKQTDGIRGRVFRTLKTSLLLSVAATVATAPLVAYAFHYFSVLSPVSNLLVAPLIGFVIVPCSVTASFVWLATGYYPFASVISTTTELSLWLVKKLASVPCADLKIPAFPVAVLLLVYGGLIVFGLTRKKQWLLASLAPLVAWGVFTVMQPKTLTVTFADVGQGDSAVVELPDGKTLVIDTGRTGMETAGILRHAGIRRIDALVLSHGHPDHTGGVERLFGLFPVAEVWLAGRNAIPVPKPTRVRRLEQADMAEAPGYRITVLNPSAGNDAPDNDDYNEENNSSLVLKIEGKARAFLFPGDVQEETGESLAGLGSRLQSDVLKVPHHGSRSSVQDEFLGLISPEIAVISVGRENSFGHPSPEMLEALDGLQVYRTDLDGAVRITEAGDMLKCRTWRENLWEPGTQSGAEYRNIRRLFTTW